MGILQNVKLQNAKILYIYFQLFPSLNHFLSSNFAPPSDTYDGDDATSYVNVNLIVLVKSNLLFRQKLEYFVYLPSTNSKPEHFSSVENEKM